MRSITSVSHGIHPSGSTRYFHVQNSLVNGKYMTAGYIVLFIALVISAVIVVMFGVLVGVAVIQ